MPDREPTPEVRADQLVYARQSEWRSAIATGIDMLRLKAVVAAEIRAAADAAAVRERELMECGHPRACLAPEDRDGKTRCLTCEVRRTAIEHRDSEWSGVYLTTRNGRWYGTMMTLNEFRDQIGALNVELESLSGQSTFSPFAVVSDAEASGGQAIECPNNGSNKR